MDLRFNVVTGTHHKDRKTQLNGKVRKEKNYKKGNRAECCGFRNALDHGIHKICNQRRIEAGNDTKNRQGGLISSKETEKSRNTGTAKTLYAGAIDQELHEGGKNLGRWDCSRRKRIVKTS